MVKLLPQMLSDNGEWVPPTTLAQVQAAAAEVASAVRNNQSEVSDDPVARQMVETLEKDLIVMFYERENVREKLKRLHG